MENKKTIRVGVINWDACLPKDTFFGSYTLSTLGNEKYEHRLPYYAKKENGEYDFSYRTQEEYDRELKYAVDAGIDFFAYCWYPDTLGERNFWKDSGNSILSTHYYELNIARKLYQKSPINKDIKMCAILFTGRAYAESDIEDLIHAMQQDYYEKVDSKPIVFTYGAFEEDFISELKKRTEKYGIDPYIAVLNSSATIHPELNYQKADVISAYSVSPKGESFDDVISEVEKKNYKRLESGLREIPLMSIGWNPMPRVDTPCPWSPYPEGPYAPQPTEAQIDKCFDKLFEFVEKNPTKADTGYVMIYAWNEFEEGGYLCPTLGKDGKPDTKFLESFSKVRKKYR